MKRTIKLAVLTILVCISTLLLFSCSSEPSTFDYEIVDGKAYLTHINKAEILLFSEIEHVTLPEMIDGYEVVGVRAGAFSETTTVRSVHIPKGILYIEEGAFSYSDGIESFSVDEGNPNYKAVGADLYSKDGKVLIQYAPYRDREEYLLTVPDGIFRIASGAFAGIDYVEVAVLPATVSEIGDYAFYYCSRLRSVTLPDALVSVGEYAFAECDKLSTVSFGTKLSSIGEYTFDRCMNLAYIDVSPDNASFKSERGVLYSADGKRLVKYPPLLGSGASYEVIAGTQIISTAAFAYTEIVSITFPDTLTEIENEAFIHSLLRGVTIPDSVTVIGDRAFLYSFDVARVELGASLERIGALAFSYCDKLAAVNIPASVTHIGERAFSCCEFLNDISVDEENLHYIIISGALYTKDGKTLIQYPIASTDKSFAVPEGTLTVAEEAFSCACNIERVVMPDSVASIMDGAFYECSSLREVKLSSSLTDIGSAAFMSCNNLTAVKLPDGVVNIGDDAFYWCLNLREVNIPNSVKRIGDSAFSRTSIESIALGGGVEYIGRCAFLNSALREVTVPASVEYVGYAAFSEEVKIHFENTEGWFCTTCNEEFPPDKMASARKLRRILYHDGIATKEKYKIS